MNDKRAVDYYDHIKKCGLHSQQRAEGSNDKAEDAIFEVMNVELVDISQMMESSDNEGDDMDVKELSRKLTSIVPRVLHLPYSVPRSKGVS